MHLIKRLFGLNEPTTTVLSVPTDEMAPSNAETANLIWNSIPETAALKVWSGQLRALTTEISTNHAWDMVGRAVIIEAEDEGDVLELMPQIADAANMKLRLLSSDAVIHGYPTWFNEIEVDTPTMLVLRAGQWCSEKFSEISPPRSTPSIKRTAMQSVQKQAHLADTRQAARQSCGTRYCGFFRRTTGPIVENRRSVLSSHTNAEHPRPCMGRRIY